MRQKNTNIRPILSAACLLIFLGMNLAPVAAANITVNSGMKNSDIQNLINNANAGDTINFNGGTYHNVSLTINKKLNVVTTKNVVLNGNGSSVNETGKTTFVFFFTNQSSGSVLSGFKVNTKSDYAIILSNVKNLNMENNSLNGGYRGSIYVKSSSNINLTNNTISNSGGNGVTIDTSKAVNLYNNLIQNNQKDGVHIQNSQKTNLTLNNILNSGLNGITLYSSNNTIIHNNSINDNNGQGISLSDIDTANITGNNITYNRLNGLLFGGSTKGTYVTYNYFIHDLNGIFLDSMSYNDVLRSNFISKSYQTSDTDYNSFYTGNGIKVGDNYQDTSSRILIEHNTIYGNDHFSIEGDANFDRFQVGANFYGTNDKWSCGVCPMISTKLLNGNVAQSLNGFQFMLNDPSLGGIQVIDIAESSISWSLSVLNSDNTTTSILNNSVSQLVNGTSTLNYKIDKTKTYIATVIVNGVKYTYQLEADNSTGQGENGNGTSGTGNGTSPVQGNNNTSGTGNNSNGNGGNTNINNTGGNSNSNGTGSGDSGSGSSTSNGTITGNGKDLTQIGLEGASANKGGQQSAGDLSGGSSNAVEVAVKNAINKTINNPFNSLGIIALMGLIGIGYFKRDKLK